MHIFKRNRKENCLSTRFCSMQSTIEHKATEYREYIYISI